jgi:hypothetical protein
MSLTAAIPVHDDTMIVFIRREVNFFFFKVLCDKEETYTRPHFEYFCGRSN